MGESTLSSYENIQRGKPRNRSGSYLSTTLTPINDFRPKQMDAMAEIPKLT